MSSKSPSDGIRLLGFKDVERALPMREAVDAMRSAFADLSARDADAPVRTSIDMETFNSGVLFMPSYASSIGSFAVKVVSMHPENRQTGLEAIQGYVLLLDAENGKLLALLDGRAVTAIRTGAGSGLATDLLARQDARSVAIFGTGVQARSHFEAVFAVRDVKRAIFIGRSEGKTQQIADEMQSRFDIDVQATLDPDRSAEADIICTTTTATEPILLARHVRPGMHINAVGTHRPADAEVASEVVVGAKVVVDQREACLKEAGDILRPIAEGLIETRHIFAEIGELVLGRRPARTTPDEVTLFKSVGNAVQDLYASRLAFENARQQGLGTTFTME